MRARKFKPLQVGDRFGRLTVIAEQPDVRESGYGLKTFWKCRCDCGTIKWVQRSPLVKGDTRSCGCLQRELNATRSANKVKGTPEHYVRATMLQRCYNPKNEKYPRYGGRGIRVCERWQESFENFLADVGRRPSPLHTIGRIDNNGHYEPGNVEWQLAWQQNRNRSNNVFLTYENETLCVADWEKKMGFDKDLIRNRIRRGWSGNDLFKPVRNHKPYKPRTEKSTNYKLKTTTKGELRQWKLQREQVKLSTTERMTTAEVVDSASPMKWTLATSPRSRGMT